MRHDHSRTDHRRRMGRPRLALRLHQGRTSATPSKTRSPRSTCGALRVAEKAPPASGPSTSGSRRPCCSPSASTPTSSWAHRRRASRSSPAPTGTRCRPNSKDWTDDQFTAAGFRAVPGAVVRRGSFIAKDAVLMPSFVNIGAYVGEGTMVDTWTTVGSCAQIGKHCHLSGGVGIGGVLEPLQANPVIIEDNCFIGARSEVAEGVIVREGSVVGMGVYLGQSTPIVNRATGETLYRRSPALLRRRRRQPPRLHADARPELDALALLRRHRQTGRRTDALQDQRQRTPARVTPDGEEALRLDRSRLFRQEPDRQARAQGRRESHRHRAARQLRRTYGRRRHHAEEDRARALAASTSSTSS